MKPITTIATLFLFFYLLSCGKRNDFAKEQSSVKIASIENSPAPGPIGNQTDTTGFFDAPQITDNKKQGPSGRQKEEPAVDWDKKIVKTAELNLELTDFKGYNNSLREKIKQVGGYVAGEELRQSDYKIENSMTIKVPVDQFDHAMSMLSDGAEKINEKKVSSQDVTTQIVDIKSRLEAKKQARLRYMDFLKDAKNVGEILSVQNEINGIQEEIESAMGRVSFLNHSSSFSTINLIYFQVLNVSANDNSKPSFGHEIKEAFKTGWGWLSDLFISLVSIWPLLMILYGGVILLRRSRSRKPKTV